MSEVFPPIQAPIHTGVHYDRVDPAPRTQVQTSQSIAVYSDKQVIDTQTLTLYANDGNVKTVKDTARTIDLLI